MSDKMKEIFGYNCQMNAQICGICIDTLENLLSLNLEKEYCDVFGRLPSLLGNLKLDTPVVARQPKVKHLHEYARDSVLSRCMFA
jgi:hypothetical protein